MSTFGAIVVRFDVVVLGVIAGIGYAVLAAGLVLVYRATKVINLAHGQIGSFSAIVLAVLVHRAGVPYGASVVVALVCGAAIGVVIERGLVAPLARRSRLAVLVATIGVTQVLLVAGALMPGIHGQRFPVPIEATLELGSLVLQGEHFAMVLFGPVALGLLSVVLTHTKYGLAVRAVADNPRASQLSGINTRRVSTMVWAMAGVMAALAAILILPLSGAIFSTQTTVALGPALLLRALAAGLVGGLNNLPRTLFAGLGIGVVEAVLFASYPRDLGLVDVVLFLFILGLLLIRRADPSDADDSLSFGDEPVAVPRALRDHPRVRLLRRGSVGAAVAVVVLLPFVFPNSADLFLLARIPVYAIIGISIVVLTGWGGQLSLAQMTFVGVGAMGTAALASRGVPYGAALVYATAGGVLLSLAVGAPALRLRGLLLTVTTLGLAVAASSYLLAQDMFRSGLASVSVVTPGKLGPFDFDSFRTDYYACVIALAGAVLVARRLRRSGIGRSLIAVECNETSAAAMSVSPAVAKLTVFAVSGAMATFAGGLLAGVTRTFESVTFAPDRSLQVLAMVVVGGVGSVGGAVLGAIYLVGVPTLFGDSTTVRLATSGIGLLVILRFAPGGLIGVANAGRDRLLRRLVGAPAAARPATDADNSDASPTKPDFGRVSVTRLAETRPKSVAALECRDMTIRFGDRVVVDHVDLSVGRDEIVGLIGANGAGKTTLMNAVSGFVAADGDVELHGEAIAALSPTQRARAGLGRSFQGARLYPRLTVRECVQVALEARERSELIPSLLALPPSVRLERFREAAADDLLDVFGLGERAEQRCGELSTGTRRLVELACLLALEPRVVLLDEPVAGLAQREAEAFGPVLSSVRGELGAAMLVIEHDLPLVMEISDRLYCLESGAVIAQGAPEDVRNNPRVVASYLGTDERAIRRSGTRRKITAGTGGGR